MGQKQDVIDAMVKHGGYATLQYLNQHVDVSTWGTKTPYASIRRIVQVNSEFFKIRPGLWALRAFEEDVLKKFFIQKGDKKSEEVFTHGYFQGIIVELGKIQHYDTYVPAQDKGRLFLEERLGDLTTLDKLPDFTHEKLLRNARTVDVIWFNERRMPRRFYEVEHSTDFRNSLDKFYELQDFRSDYYIIADEKRRSHYEDVISKSIYSPIRKYVRFFSYEKLIAQYESESSITDRI